MWKNDSSIDYYIHHVGSISAFIACVVINNSYLF